jgi:pyridoxal 5'-phosphate synthase pdxT subunit
VVAGPEPGPRIGVLDLQGDVREHLAALGDVGCQARRVKGPSDLEGLRGLVVPGGESTTLSMLLDSTGLFDAIEARLGSGTLPVMGTCAGLILVARQVLDGRADQRSFAVLDAVVRRNGYGRQAQSFEADLVLGSGEDQVLPAVFIRAPLIVSVGHGVEVLASLDGAPVLVRQGSVLASAFHPELTEDRRVHRLFAELCGTGAGRPAGAPGGPGETVPLAASDASSTRSGPAPGSDPTPGGPGRPEEVPSGLGRI